jgi:uncharacterized protein (TIGR00251 family)
VTCYRVEPGALVLAVRLTPKAGRDAIGDIVVLADGREAVRVHVRAIPSGGEANRALIALLAKTFRVPKSGIEIVAGDSARLKQVRIPGDPSALAAIVSGWMPPA